jgi:hypothetical protein
MAKPTVAAKAVSIRLRMTVEDKREIEEKARERKLTVTEFLTRAGLGRSARQRADVDAINLLRDCVDELKCIHATLKTGGDRLESLANETLDEPMRAVIAAINRVWQTGDER